MTKNTGARYRKALKKAGFTSYKRANRRRGDLIDKKHDGRIDKRYDGLTESETCELANLQKACLLYVQWKFPMPKNPKIERLLRELKKRGIE